MSEDKNLLYYWDTCVFLSWIKNEQRSPEIMTGLRDIVIQIENNEARMITSALTRAEILMCTLAQKEQEKFVKVMERSNVEIYGTDFKIWELTHKIRNFYHAKNINDGLNTLTIPDSVHLATAIHFDADELHTYDEFNSNKKRALIPLSGNVAGEYNIKICKPMTKQLSVI